MGGQTNSALVARAAVLDTSNSYVEKTQKKAKESRKV